MAYRYNSYTEIPGNVSTFIKNVTGYDIHDFTMTQINNLLIDLDEEYRTYNLKLSYFLEN